MATPRRRRTSPQTEETASQPESQPETSGPDVEAMRVKRRTAKEPVVSGRGRRTRPSVAVDAQQTEDATKNEVEKETDDSSVAETAPDAGSWRGIAKRRQERERDRASTPVSAQIVAPTHGAATPAIYAKRVDTDKEAKELEEQIRAQVREKRLQKQQEREKRETEQREKRDAIQAEREKEQQRRQELRDAQKRVIEEKRDRERQFKESGETQEERRTRVKEEREEEREHQVLMREVEQERKEIERELAKERVKQDRERKKQDQIEHRESQKVALEERRQAQKEGGGKDGRPPPLMDTKKINANIRDKWKWFIRKFQPWRLPDDWPKTEDMSDTELAEEARAQRHLLTAVGFFDSAIFHAAIMNQQYLRICQFTGTIPVRPYVVFFAAPIVMAVTFGVIFAINVYNAQNTASNLATIPWYMGFVLGGGFGLFCGVGMGFPMMAAMQFKTAYASSLAFQLNEFDEPLQCFGVPVLRMACIDNPNLIFTGSGEEAGFDTGDLLLRVPPGVDISQMHDSSAVCRWESLQGSFIGTNAREEWSLQSQAEIAGLSNPRGSSHKNTGQVLKEWSGVLIFIGAFIGCIFLLTSEADSNARTNQNTAPNPAVATPVPVQPTEVHNPQPWNPPEEESEETEVETEDVEGTEEEVPGEVPEGTEEITGETDEATTDETPPATDSTNTPATGVAEPADTEPGSTSAQDGNE